MMKQENRIANINKEDYVPQEEEAFEKNINQREIQPIFFGIGYTPAIGDNLNSLSE